MSDPLEEVAKEIAKNLPLKELYTDAGSPAAKATGSILEDLIKTVHLALAPLQLTAALQDRVRRLIDRSIRQVPEERRVSPAPQILGPVLEGVRYEPEGTPVDEMFAELLNRASDSERVSEAHPAYPHLIRQLSSDEAVVLRTLSKSKKLGRRQTATYHASTNRFDNFVSLREDFPDSQLRFPQNLSFYVDHLWNLGLAGLFKANEKPIYANGKQVGTDIEYEYRLTDLGERFIGAVLAKEPTGDLP